MYRIISNNKDLTDKSIREVIVQVNNKSKNFLIYLFFLNIILNVFLLALIYYNFKLNSELYQKYLDIEMPTIQEAFFE
jgi:hypothetical protein